MMLKTKIKQNIIPTGGISLTIHLEALDLGKKSVA